jgi:iron-sulfur cluster repair protein YtfE (RIC family)
VTRRHPSLVSLSHDHHHGLALALRLRRGLEQAPAVERFYESDLRPHFRTEEEVVFPLVLRDLPDAAPLVGRLVEQHREMERIVAEIGRLQGQDLAERLAALGAILDRHIRIEERELFEMLQERLAPEALDRLGEQIERHRGTG